MAYLLDANVFIKAKNDEYGFELCPGFWQWLDHANQRQAVFSIDAVRDELLGHDDELAEWARPRGDAFFLPPDELMLDQVGVLSEWVTEADRYTPAAKNDFLGKPADIYLVAHALAYEHTVVTLEQADSKKNKVKIPEVAIPHQVKCIRPYEMLRIEGAQFVLKGAA